MDDMIRDALLKGLISIERHPRSEELCELIRSTKTAYRDNLDWLDFFRANRN